ncbi:MAG: PadR family transcriptional regulator [Mobilicoccus sp.]|nr:PadR family transcriptional regulator [Mobilicoccus sp.]
MSVFGHGQMRLYLLALLAEEPRHGYDMIRALEERFGGLYSPSAGTVYPRLAKLEEEGLVERIEEGRKALYRLTDAGRAEVEARAEEIAELESSLDASAHRLAEDMRRRVQSGAADLRSQIAAATAGIGEGMSSRYWAEETDGESRGHDRHDLDDLFTALTRGQLPDADAISRAAQSMRRLAEGTPWQQWSTGERPWESWRSPETPWARRERQETADADEPAAAEDGAESEVAGDATDVPYASAVTSPVGEAATPLVAVPVDPVDSTEERSSGAEGASEDREPPPGFPTSEQVREVVAILKDAGERIQDVLTRPR